MTRYFVWMVAGLVTLTLAACSTQTAQTSGNTANAAANVGVPAPPGTLLARVQMGMHKKQVSDAIGHPTDENSYSTGKAFIPFYFGNDARRTSWYYKGQGRVVFADGNVFGGGVSEAIRVDYDP